MPREIHWTDAEEIGIQLQEKFPTSIRSPSASPICTLRDGARRLRRRSIKIE